MNLDLLLELARERPWLILLVAMLLVLACSVVVDCVVALISGTHLLTGRRLVPSWLVRTP